MRLVELARVTDAQRNLVGIEENLTQTAMFALGFQDFLRKQELTANCTLVEILMSLKSCSDF